MSPVPLQRAGVLLALLLLPAVLAGCLESPEAELARRGGVEEPVGADFPFVPTPPPTRNATPPRPTDPTPDPRLDLDEGWARGDSWYYESNHSRWMKITVTGAKRFDGVPHYVVKTESGLLGHGPSDTTIAHVTRDFRTVNATLEDGYVEYDPPHPGFRFLPRYGNYTYNESGFQRIRGHDMVWHRNSTVIVQEVAPLGPVKTLAGTVNASGFRLFTLVRDRSTGAQTVGVADRWYSPELRHDIGFVTNVGTKDAERFYVVYYVRDGQAIGHVV